MSRIFLRIKNVLNYRKPYFGLVIIAVVVVVIAAASFGTDSSNGSFGSVSWTDENNNQIQYVFTLGDQIVFEDEVYK